MSQRPQQHRAHEPNAISGFIDRYGWRAYALPVLALLTVVGLFRASSGHGRAEAVGEHGVSPSAAGATPTTTPATTPTTTPTTTPSATSASTTSAPPPVRKISLAADTGKASKQTVAPRAPAAPTPCHNNTSARKVLVSIADQHAWMCAGKKLVYASVVTTGKSGGHATPTGTFKIQGNVTNTMLRGSDYAVHVAYWIPFNGDIGFHDASWQTMAFGASGYTTQGSRGCVHMPMPTIAWLHKWVRVGQTVVVVRKS